MRSRLRQQGRDLCPLEGDRRALGVVLVVRVGRDGGADDVLQGAAERAHPGEKLGLLGGERLAQLEVPTPLLVRVAGHARRNQVAPMPIPARTLARRLYGWSTSSPDRWRREADRRRLVVRSPTARGPGAR